MARLPRLSIAGLPHHVIQRGNNRQPIFASDNDRRALLGLMAEYAQTHRVAIHAYVLMDNHFHVLATPEDATGLPLFMQAVGRRYVRHFNDRQGRSGTLWEGRYKSTLIQTDRYLLTCMAYIDLNPVRAGIVAEARDFMWSSHGHYVGLRSDRIVTPPSLYWSLGNTPFAREAAYAELVRGGIASADQRALTDSTLRGWALGDEAFLEGLQGQTERRVRKASAGRPRSARRSADN